jgi:hypothetical protein
MIGRKIAEMNSAERIVMSWRARLSTLGFAKEPSSGALALAGESAADVFSRVYRNNHWGRRWGRKFFSGPGSHDQQVIEPYVRAVTDFLAQMPGRPKVVDLGCGDFQVGSRLRPVCGDYVACDVVPELIGHNRKAFARLQVEFVCLNIIEDALPEGEVAFLRQVLQHLSNAQIASVVPKLARYDFVVVTEHLPVSPEFQPNLDHQFGSGIRVTRNSGVVLTAPPFNLKVATARRLCSVPHGGGVIETVVYGM